MIIVTANVGLLRSEVSKKRAKSQNLVGLYKSARAESSHRFRDRGTIEGLNLPGLNGEIECA
jgi:hypothetical protein